ncbi:MAG: O-methyltransferase [Gammaproteobacteria bacterium]|jgi:O-methyltransferase
MFHRVIDFLGARLFGAQKYRYAQYKRAKKIARRQGYEIYKSHLIWFQDPEYLTADALVKKKNITGIPSDRCYVLLEFARQVRQVPGDIAECGVRYGKSSIFILTGLGDDSTKVMNIFDSFAGLSKPGQEDANPGGKTVWETGELAVPETAVRENLSQFGDRIVLYKGWIPARFQEVATQQFAFVHIDVDLYQPTLDSVRFFYERLAPGGVMICDDYGSDYCPGAKQAFDEFFDDKPEGVIALPTGQAVVIKQRIHGAPLKLDEH